MHNRASAEQSSDVLHLSGEDSVDNRLIKPPPAPNACHKSFIVTLGSPISLAFNSTCIPIASAVGCTIQLPWLKWVCDAFSNGHHRGHLGKQMVKLHLSGSNGKAQWLREFKVDMTKMKSGKHWGFFVNCFERDKNEKGIEEKSLTLSCWTGVSNTQPKDLLSCVPAHISRQLLYLHSSS